MTRELKVSKTCMDKESTLKELRLGYINLADGLFDLTQINFDMVICPTQKTPMPFGD